MAKDVRERMIVGAHDLLSRHGLQSTSFAEVTQATDTPRGSIYHHFPGGKQELVLAALDISERDYVERLHQIPRINPEQYMAAMFEDFRHSVLDRDFEAGCAATAVTVAAENDEQLRRCDAVFKAFIDVALDGLLACGVEPDAARDYATLALCAMDGANTMARASHGTDAIDAVERFLVAQANDLPRAPVAASA